ncbi:hypothetical protein MMC07_009947 [Pseudocyphellaria aurata]|nr:hypothetical protein [Pseudocyphellaria aurata]
MLATKAAICAASRLNLVRARSTVAHPLSKVPESFSDQDQADARKWLASFTADTIPRKLGQVSFSKSSGPGGQNVNKVNSKATVRFQMKDLTPIIPAILYAQLLASKYYAANSHSLVIHADGSRKQADNVHECFKKLWLLIEAGKTAVKGETSPEQVARVKNLQRRENEARLRAKKTHSNKKSARKGFAGGSHF